MRQSLWSRIRCQCGTSLLETMFVVAIGATVGAVGVAQTNNVRRSMQGDGAMRLVMGQLARAQQLAIQQRRNIEVQFVGGSWMKVVRHELNGSLTTLTSVSLESGMQFQLVNNVPDTPDAFGNGAALAFGAATQILFTSDGLLVDQNGNPLNGTVFLSAGGQLSSLRAVTIMGNTGRVRGYKAAANAAGNFVGWNKV